MSAKTMLRIGLLLTAAAVTYVVVSELRERRAVAVSTVEDIEAQLAALDPVTRAGVIARLSADGISKVSSMRS